MTADASLEALEVQMISDGVFKTERLSALATLDPEERAALPLPNSGIHVDSVGRSFAVLCPQKNTNKNMKKNMK